MVPDLTAPERANPVIPQSAVRYNGSLPGVYVLDANGTAQLRLVRLGEPMPNGMVTVLGGLQLNERVISDPGPNVTSGWSTQGPPGSQSAPAAQPASPLSPQRSR
jgi:hypothetical protein